jgi:hypothetical protein
VSKAFPLSHSAQGMRPGPLNHIPQRNLIYVECCNTGCLESGIPPVHNAFWMLILCDFCILVCGWILEFDYQVRGRGMCLYEWILVEGVTWLVRSIASEGTCVEIH